MAALDNPFYFSLAEEDRLESAALLGRQPKNRPTLMFNSSHDSVKYYNVKQQQQQQQHHQQQSPVQSPTKRQNPVVAATAHQRATAFRLNNQGLKKKCGGGGGLWWCAGGTTGGGGDMWDIAIYRSSSSQSASLWANYLTSCFQQISAEEKRPPFKLNCVNVEDMVCGDLGGCWSNPYSSRLQIVVVCPALLQALDSPRKPALLAALWQPATVLAMLLGVDHSALDNHPLAGLFRFEQWRKLTVKDQDPTFVGDLMGVSMDILSRSWQLEQAIHQMNIDNNKAHFSIVPKKIKVGQNKLIVLLTSPLSSSDKINIYVDKQGQQVQVTNIKRRNPYTLQFSMPVACMQTSTLVSVNVERNGRSVGQRVVKCESRLRELDQILRAVDNPIQFMAQAVGLSVADKEELDNSLVGAFHKNMPPDFNLLASNLTPTTNSRRNTEEYPTLLHFCARYGLEKLCWELVECPGGEQACQLTNATHQTPADMAHAAGHLSLATALKGYMQMSELTSMYHYIKGISEKPQGEMEECNYLLPRPLSEAYCVPPAARPVSLGITPSTPITPMPPGIQYYSSPQPLVPPPLTPTSPTSPHFAPTYLHMHSPASDQSSLRLDLDFCRGKYQNVESASLHSDQYSLTNSSHQDEEDERREQEQEHRQVEETCSGFQQRATQEGTRQPSPLREMKTKQASSSVSSASTASGGKSSPQDELVEIINDFKNNVFTISEVEKLVEAWRNRNDVQQSFREKQDQLNQMRQEYERIQQAMKEQMKRATPFERIKKFFSRKSKCVDSSPVAKGRTDGVCQRPVSSLSLHSSCSSSSSGRMSTASGTSLGDSGTHSDHDDKKSEDFIFQDKLQSVKEKETSSPGVRRMSSLGEEYRGPQPTTLAMVHAAPRAHQHQEEQTQEHQRDSTDPDLDQPDYVNTGSQPL